MSAALLPILLALSPAPSATPEQADDAQQPRAAVDTTSYEGYPIKAIREQREGVSGYEFSVSQTGDIRNCKVICSSGHADLDAATCMRLRRFPPDGIVKDEQGKYKNALYRGLMVWKLNQ